MKDVDRNMGNFSSVPLWNTTMNAKEVEYMFENYSDLVICNGRNRRVVVEKITDNLFKVSTRDSLAS